MADNNQIDYSPADLCERYALELGEAQRLITSFGGNRGELDLLLGAHDRVVSLRHAGS